MTSRSHFVSPVHSKVRRGFPFKSSGNCNSAYLETRLGAIFCISSDKRFLVSRRHHDERSHADTCAVWKSQKHDSHLQNPIEPTAQRRHIQRKICRRRPLAARRTPDGLGNERQEAETDLANRGWTLLRASKLNHRDI